MNKWTEKLVDWILALFGIFGIGAFVALFGEITKMATQFPWPLATICVICFLAGFLIAYFHGAYGAFQEQLHKKQEQSKIDKQNEIKRTSQEAAKKSRTRWIICDPPWAEKTVIKRLAEIEFFDLKNTYKDPLSDFDRNMRELVICYEVGESIWRMKLTEYGRYAVSVSSDILEEVLPPKDNQ